MSKYSKRLIDSVYEDLKDEKVKLVSGEVETAIIDTLVPNRKSWPKSWYNPSFSPCHNFADAYELLKVAFPGKNWRMVANEDEKIFECYIEDETYSVFSFTAERALVLAMWNRHNFEEAES